MPSRSIICESKPDLGSVAKLQDLAKVSHRLLVAEFNSGFFMASDTVQQIDIKLEQLRKDYPFASPVMKKFIEAGAKLLKEKRKIVARKEAQF